MQTDVNANLERQKQLALKRQQRKKLTYHKSSLSNSSSGISQSQPKDENVVFSEFDDFDRHEVQVQVLHIRPSASEINKTSKDEPNEIVCEKEVLQPEKAVHNKPPKLAPKSKPKKLVLKNVEKALQESASTSSEAEDSSASVGPQPAFKQLFAQTSSKKSTKEAPKRLTEYKNEALVQSDEVEDPKVSVEKSNDREKNDPHKKIAKKRTLRSNSVKMGGVGLALKGEGENRPPSTPPKTDQSIEPDSNFISLSAPRGKTIRCRITRDKKGIDGGLRPTYILHMERDDQRMFFLLAAKRRKNTSPSYYVISNKVTDLSHKSVACVGKLKSNFMGTTYAVTTVQSHEPSEEIAAIVYETNVLGFKGPRKMTIVLPRMDNNERIKFAVTENSSLSDKWKANDLTNIMELHNKAPVWNEDTQSYVLNFHGRVTQASVKNFQIVHKADPDYIVLQFGRISEDVFNMDYAYPLCALQAFAIALSSFDGKIACE